MDDKLIKREQGLNDPVLDQVKAWQALMQKMKGLYFKKERKRRKMKTSDCVEEFNKNYRRQKMTNVEEESIKDTWHVRSKRDSDKSQKNLGGSRTNKKKKKVLDDLFLSPRGSFCQSLRSVNA